MTKPNMNIKTHLELTLKQMEKSNIDKYSITIERLQEVLEEFERLNNLIHELEYKLDNTNTTNNNIREINGGKF